MCSKTALWVAEERKKQKRTTREAKKKPYPFSLAKCKKEDRTLNVKPTVSFIVRHQKKNLFNSNEIGIKICAHFAVEKIKKIKKKRKITVFVFVVILR